MAVIIIIKNFHKNEKKTVANFLTQIWVLCRTSQRDINSPKEQKKEIYVKWFLWLFKISFLSRKRKTFYYDRQSREIMLKAFFSFIFLFFLVFTCDLKAENVDLIESLFKNVTRPMRRWKNDDNFIWNSLLNLIYLKNLRRTLLRQV